MKCIKNDKTGEVIRMDERDAEWFTKRGWQYCPKQEWKKYGRWNTEAQKAYDND